MFKKIILITLILTSSAYNLDKIQSLDIHLEKKINDSLNNAYGDEFNHLMSLDDYPLLKIEVKNKYVGIPKNDSTCFFGKFEDEIQLMYDLYKSKKYDKSTFLKNIKSWRIDTLNLSQKPIKQGLISVIGFYNDKQFIIGDMNRNQDFSDDVKYEFDKNFRNNKVNNPEIINNLPISNYSYEKYEFGKTIEIKRQLVLYPSKVGAYPIVTKQEFQYLSKYRYKDYWFGQKEIENKVYEFYYN